jgi:hypothetical protein
MNRGHQAQSPSLAKGSRDGKRWECDGCRAPLAERGSDDKGVYLELLPGFDLHPKKGYYFKSHRPARRFYAGQLPAQSPADNELAPVQDAQSRIHHARNTDIRIRLRLKDFKELPVVVHCERCDRFSRIPSIAVPPR